MQSETDSLRRQSRAAEASKGLNATFEFPPSTNGRQNGKSTRPPAAQSRGRATTRELSQPLPDDDTPRIERNKSMRGDTGQTRRKSSLTRGKRVSTAYASTGVISAFTSLFLCLWRRALTFRKPNRIHQSETRASTNTSTSNNLNHGEPNSF